MTSTEPAPRARRWYEHTWVIVLICVVGTAITVTSVVDLLGPDPRWVRSVVFTLFGPACLVIGWDARRRRPPA